MVCPPPDTGALEKLFRYEVLKMLKAEGKITDVIIENMMNWRHSGFNVYCGKAISIKSNFGTVHAITDVLGYYHPAP
jgi:hypothetical protein